MSDAKKYSFDEKCRDLAEHFLQDEPDELRSQECACDLAQHIQQAVEDWIAGNLTEGKPQ